MGWDDWNDCEPYRDPPEDDGETPECPDCEHADDVELSEPAGFDDDGERYGPTYCCEACGVYFGEDGEPVHDGPSDYAERMAERRAMGLSNF